VKTYKGLDLDNFEIIHQGRGKGVVLIMRDKRKDAALSWCVQYRGSGQYFKTREEALAYCKGRRFLINTNN